ncbi:MAG: hypothetical protein H7A50_06685 [Akkermansiaceae bacterium]|nr:hypothetical protein [Akkermansiaceae bacterium]
MFSGERWMIESAGPTFQCDVRVQKNHMIALTTAAMTLVKPGSRRMLVPPGAKAPYGEIADQAADEGDGGEQQ